MKSRSNARSSSDRSVTERPSRSSGEFSSSVPAGALERAVRGRHAHVQELGGLAGGPVEHVAEDQNRPLPRRQNLDDRDDGQLDRLPGDDHRAGEDPGDAAADPTAGAVDDAVLVLE
jgi:hypothetical protein